ncbi:hypothetical protein C6495_09060 [Candidatus Poribacteria bacterium]|nr:MAG: hypothetical protein C6495_09060 [Candidatus Poribacteria bacterium]
MLTHIRMKNFKSWADSGEVKLAPLTGFFGANSSGKSSLLQMLLLLKQTIGSEDVLFFGDENSLVNLGSFNEVIHRHNRDAQLELEFGGNLRKPQLVNLSLEEGRLDKTAVDGFTFNTALSAGYSEPILQSFRYASLSNLWEMEWQADSPHREGNQFLNGMNLGYAHVETCYGLPWWRGVSRKEWNWRFLRQFSSVFETFFSELYYLASTRVEPRRQTRWEGEHPIDVGKRGHDVISALLSARVKQLGQNEKRISAWLQQMKLAHAFSLKSQSDDEKDYEIRVRKNAESPGVTLVDMGYGLSQFLPVLVLCYYVPEGSTLILEQPGIHLHPRVQSQLADLLIEVVTERNLQVILESHSEHLLVRLQRRIAEGKVGRDKIGLYFCSNDEAKGVSTLEPLEVDKVGNIRNWPENFFGDVMGDMFAITDAQAKQLHMQEEGRN